VLLYTYGACKLTVLTGPVCAYRLRNENCVFSMCSVEVVAVEKPDRAIFLGRECFEELYEPNFIVNLEIGTRSHCDRV